jgi:hypothetical protein
MPHPSKETVQAVLSPFHHRIRRVVDLAWAEWRATVDFRAKSKFGPVLYPRTMANYIFDAIARYAIAEFGTDPSIHVEIESQTIKIFFKGAVLARFKKGDDNGLGQNIETFAALAFMDADGILPGMPPETAKVEFIWEANDIRTQLESVRVVARDNDLIIWEYEIDREAGSSGAVVAFPTPPSDDLDPDMSGLVKPKTSKIKKTDTE